MNFEALINTNHLREVSVRVSKLNKFEEGTKKSALARQFKFWTPRFSIFQWATGLDYQVILDYAAENPPTGSVFKDPERKIRDLRKRIIDAEVDDEKLKAVVLEEFAVFKLFPNLANELIGIPFDELSVSVKAYDKALLEKVPKDIEDYLAELKEAEIQRRQVALQHRRELEEINRLCSTEPVISKASVVNFEGNIRNNRVVISFAIPHEFGSAIASGLWNLFKGRAEIRDDHEAGKFDVIYDRNKLPQLHSEAESLSKAIDEIFDLHPDRAGLVSPSAAAKSLGISLDDVKGLIEAGALRPRKTITVKRGLLAGRTFHGIAPRDLMELVQQ